MRFAVILIIHISCGSPNTCSGNTLTLGNVLLDSLSFVLPLVPHVSWRDHVSQSVPQPWCFISGNIHWISTKFMFYVNTERIAGSSGRAVWRVDFHRLESETVCSNPAQCMHVLFSYFYAILSCVGRGLCDGLITRSKESHQVSKIDWRNPPCEDAKVLLSRVEPWWKEGRTEIYQEIKFIHIDGSMTHIFYIKLRSNIQYSAFLKNNFIEHKLKRT
jgi:hypothetical protein